MSHPLRPRVFSSRVRRPLPDRPGAIGRCAVLAAAAIGFCSPAAASQAVTPSGLAVRDWSALPDWDGVWAMEGDTLFDKASVEPRNGAPGAAGVRERPPYNAEWEAKYLANIALVRAGKFVDPVTTCGIPPGMPRMLNLTDGFEWVVRPDQVWQVSPNGGSVRRIYTDGRPHLSDDEIYATFTGDNIGHWEGDALVVDTISLRDDTILDRTGLVHSEALHVVQRVRKTGADTMEVQMTLEDPVAFTRPWRVTKRYHRVSGPAYVYDYACAEHNPDPMGRDARPNANALPTPK